MPQTPLLTDQLQIEPGTTTFGTRIINRNTTDGSLQFADPNVTAVLQNLVGLRNITGVTVVGRAGDGAEYTVVQDAIDAAPSNATADTPHLILILPGVYSEALTITKDAVHLVGLGHAVLRNPAASATPTVLYQEGATVPLNALLQNLIIENGENAEACVEVSGVNTFASGTVTVVNAPLAAADVLTIGGTALTGVTGARTSGSNNFSVDGVTVAAIATEIAAAVNDTANSFDLVVSALALGAVVTITAVVAGVGGNAITLVVSTTPAGGMTLSGATLTGGGAPPTLLSDKLSILDCTLLSTGVGGFPIDANICNNIEVFGGTWRGSASTANTRVLQTASFRVFEVEWTNNFELAYDSGGSLPSIGTSVYSVAHVGRANDFLVNLTGVGGLGIDHCGLVGNITQGGDRTLTIGHSRVGTLTMSGTAAVTLRQSQRGLGSVAGGTPTLAEDSFTGAVVFAASSSEIVLFDVPQPDSTYAVYLDSPTLGIIPQATTKVAASFTATTSAPLTGTVFYTVARAL